MSYPVIISYNSTNHKEQNLVMDLGNYLSTKGIVSLVDDPNRSELMMRQQLLSAQWLILVLTPEAIRSRGVQLLVNTALERVKQGQMQGVLALAFSSTPVEAEDMPNPIWSTIRTYYVSESNEDYLRAFEKVSRTLKAPMYAGSSSTSNWASFPGSPVAPGFRPLSARFQTQKRLSRLTTFVLIAGALLIVLGSMFAVFALLQSRSSTPSPTQAQSTLIVPSDASSAAATATATDAENIYKKYTGKKAGFVMNAQDSNQQWAQQTENGTCAFNSKGAYEVTNDMVGQYVPCMERKMQFTNFVYQVQMTIVGGDAGGLIFRADDSLTTFYRFSLTSQDNYALFLCQPPDCASNKVNSGKSLVKGSAHLPRQYQALVRQRSLTVIAKGEDIYLYIDGKFVGSTKDSPPSQGEIGVYAASVSNTKTDVVFSEVEVWELQ